MMNNGVMNNSDMSGYDERSVFIDYDDIRALQLLHSRKDTSGNPFPSNSCCDYVDSIEYDTTSGTWYVTVFVEPCGCVVKGGSTLSEVLYWWHTVFATQPSGMSYIDAGWHLYTLWLNNKLPDDPKDVWAHAGGAHVARGGEPSCCTLASP